MIKAYPRRKLASISKRGPPKRPLTNLNKSNITIKPCSKPCIELTNTLVAQKKPKYAKMVIIARSRFDTQ